MAVRDAQHFLHLLASSTTENTTRAKEGIVLRNAFCDLDGILACGRYISYQLVVKSGGFKHRSWCGG